METADLKSTLAQFNGTEDYYRIYPKVVLTDCTKYHADRAESYWLMDLYASHLASEDQISLILIAIFVIFFLLNLSL